MAKGKARSLIRMVSSAFTGHFYIMSKARGGGASGVVQKMTMVKYDPVIKKRVLYTEAKLR